tara:strand:+ start:308 stop:691 length:384 start_codon:yes stop_codon:yes gene_type:complete
MIQDEVVFYFDGECPFCRYFAELVEIKSDLPNIKIVNARLVTSEFPQNYDMDISGAFLKVNGEIHTGAEAINYICSRIRKPSNKLLELLASIFSSSQRSNFIFPYLLIARRIALSFKGVPIKLKVQP